MPITLSEAIGIIDRDGAIRKAYSPPEYNLYDELTNDEYYVMHAYLYKMRDTYYHKDIQELINCILHKIYNAYEEFTEEESVMLCQRILEGKEFHNNGKECDIKMEEFGEWAKHSEFVDRWIKLLEDKVCKYILLDLPFNFDRDNISCRIQREINNYCDKTIRNVLFDQFKVKYGLNDILLFKLLLTINKEKYVKQIGNIRNLSVHDFQQILENIPKIS